MSRRAATKLTLPLVLTLGLAMGYIIASINDQPVQPSNAAEKDDSDANDEESHPTVSPVKARPSRDTYYPNTEDLAPDEMRVVACGTGMPTTRAFQAAACFLVELGNGDKFLFDCG